MDVLVVGGGLIGSAAAVRLQDQGLSVLQVDPGDEQGRASYGNATLIANELAEPLASWANLRALPGRLFARGGPVDFVWRDIGVLAPWAVRYLAACSSHRFAAGREALDGLLRDAAPAWTRLAADIRRPDLVDARPHWAVWESDLSLQAGAPGARAGASTAVQVRDLASQEMEALRRDVSAAFRGGISFEGSAKLTDPAAMVRALQDRLAERGAAVLAGRVRALSETGGGIEARLADGSVVEADRVLVAAGARSAPLVRGFGLPAPLIAERGYHLQYAEHGLARDAPPLVLEDRFICVVQCGSCLRVTGFTELGRADSPPDPRKWERLRRHVEELALPVASEPDRWMGSRPTLPDFLPAIGRRGRLLYAFGHQHIGVTLAAVTADAVAELAGGGGERLHPFRLERFG